MVGLQEVLEAGDSGCTDPVGARGRGRRKAADLVGRIGRDPDEDVAGWAGGGQGRNRGGTNWWQRRRDLEDGTALLETRVWTEEGLVYI